MEDLKQRVAEVAAELAGQSGTWPPELRQRFIAVREALIVRGIFDPVLQRFDSYSAPKADASEVTAQLAAIAEAL